MDDILKVTKTNFVVMKLAAGGHKHDSQVGTEYCMYEHGNSLYMEGQKRHRLNASCAIYRPDASLSSSSLL